MVTETWLEESETFLFQINDFSAVHSCRAGRGGGVAIYVRKSIKFREIEKSSKGEPINWICISLGVHNLKISVIYKPPSLNNCHFLPFLESVLLKHSKKHLIIGDMNINLLDDSQVIKDYKDLVAVSNFKINNLVSEEFATRVTRVSKSLIDHVLSDYSGRLDCKVNVKENALSDHKLILIDVKSSVQIQKPKVDYEVKCVNYNRFVNLFREKALSINVVSFQQLIDLVIECKKKSEYAKKLRIRSNNTWMNNEVLEMLKKRDKLYKKKVNQPENLYFASEFKNIKNQINNKIRALKNRFFQEKWEMAGNNTKKQWTFINSFIKDKKGKVLIDSLLIENNIVNSQLDIVNKLNEYFSQVGESIVKDLESEMDQLNDDFSVSELNNNSAMSVPLTDEHELLDIIKELRQNSAPGHDEITVRDINNLREHILPILAHLINKTIQSGIFPQELKISKITPLFKSGDKKVMNNYRPISVLSVFSKILEKLIKNRMLSFIDTCQLTDEFQYGFIKNSSTLGAAVDFIDYISRAVDRKEVVVAVLVDLK